MNTTLSNKKNAYRSYIVPILSYGSQLWKLTFESVQKKAVTWIFGSKTAIIQMSSDS